MTRKSRLPIAFGSGTVLLILILVVGSVVYAQEGQGLGSGIKEGQSSPEAVTAPIPGGPGFVSLSAFGFRNYESTASFAFDNTALYNPGGTLACYSSPISLPHGATITKYVLYYYDNSTSYVQAWLYAIPLDTSTVYGMAFIQTTGAVANFRYAEDTLIDYSIIDNQSYSYTVHICLPPSSSYRLNGMRVDYDYSSSLPVILKQ